MKLIAPLAASILFLLSALTLFVWMDCCVNRQVTEAEAKWGAVYFGLQFICASYCMIYIFMGVQ